MGPIPRAALIRPRGSTHSKVAATSPVANISKVEAPTPLMGSISRQVEHTLLPNSIHRLVGSIRRVIGVRPSVATRKVVDIPQAPGIHRTGWDRGSRSSRSTRAHPPGAMTGGRETSPPTPLPAGRRATAAGRMARGITLSALQYLPSTSMRVVWHVGVTCGRPRTIGSSAAHHTSPTGDVSPRRRTSWRLWRHLGAALAASQLLGLG
jgi:hypothetical protein